MILEVGLVVLGLFLFVLYIRKTKKENTLFTESTPVSKLSTQEKCEIWLMFEKFFEKEFDTFDEFDCYLKTDMRHVLLFRRQIDHILQGFIILSVDFDKHISGKAFSVIRGEFFALAKEFRSHSSPLVSLLLFTIYVKLRHPFTTLYYFFITYSYRSYLSFGRAMAEYYPRHHCQIPHFEKKVLDTLGEEAARLPYQWGCYSPNNCVIKDHYKGSKGRLKMSSGSVEPPAGRKCLAESLEFFLEQNPGHKVGDCFCVLAPVTYKNFFCGLLKAAFRLLGVGSKRRHETISEQKDVAFGRGQRKGDTEANEM